MWFGNMKRIEEDWLVKRIIGISSEKCEVERMDGLHEKRTE